MNRPATIHQVRYVLRIRSEYPPIGSPVFRGTLETIAGQKFEFSTLAELNSFLFEICGWIDSFPRADEAGEPDMTCKGVSTAGHEGKS